MQPKDHRMNTHPNTATTPEDRKKSIDRFFSEQNAEKLSVTKMRMLNGDF